MSANSDGRHQASSTGQSGTRSGWLDAHFEALRPEYEEIVQSVGLKPGWHVLDAGCGSGSFIPLIADLVGSRGRVTAIDLAPDNVEHVEQRLAGWELPCPVEIHVGSLESLPFPDGHFDAVWLANVLMYFTADALPGALSELRRVVRPGGLIVSKEGDARTGVLYPLPTTPAHHAPLLALDGIPGIYRARELHHWYREAGFVDVTRWTRYIERFAPLNKLEQQYIGELIRGFAGVAERLDLPTDAAEFWQQQADPASPDALVNHPHFAYAIGHVVTVGTVPRS